MGSMPDYSVSFGEKVGRRVSVVAGAKGIWRFSFECGDRPVRPGGAVKLFCEVPRIWLCGVYQTQTPQSPGYVSVEGADGLVCEVVKVPSEWKQLDWAVISLPEGMKKGQKLTVTFGSVQHLCYVVAHKYKYAPVSWRVDYDATGEFYRFWPPIVLKVVPGRAAKMKLVVPSEAVGGKSLRVRGRIEDKNSNIGASYEKPIRLQLLDENFEPLAGYEDTVVANNEGIIDFSQWNAPEKSSVYRVRAETDSLPVCVSNAVEVRNENRHTTLWGDCHAHSMWADGVGTIDDNFRYARDQAFLDVFGLSEHLNNNEEFDTFPQFKPGTDYSLLGPHVADAVGQYHEPGSFITILSAEYSPSFKTEGPKGDFCIYTESDDFGDLPMARKCPDLLGMAKKNNCICIPHVGGHILPWDIFPIDTDVTPLLEIAAMHGHFERFAQEALQLGHRMGFVGMADGHFGMPGYDNWPRHGRTPKLKHRNFSTQSAITGYIVDSFTREAVFAAMRQRRTYATTGERILLHFSIQDAPMGAEVSSETNPVLRISVHGTSPLALIEIVRGDRRVLQKKGDGAYDSVFSWTDETPISGDTWYYVRVTQEDFAIAWSSPIWVHYSGPGGVDPESAATSLPAWNDPPFWPPNLPETVDPAHTERLRKIFADRELTNRFVNLRQTGVHYENRGRFARFLATDAELGGKTVHIHLFIDFEDDRLYIFEGEPDYGVIYKWE